MGELFADHRGGALRVTWHAAPGVVVLSIWRVDRCVGTVRLDPEEATRLAAFLQEAVAGEGPVVAGS
jgi:hypothetical protein